MRTSSITHTCLKRKTNVQRTSKLTIGNAAMVTATELKNDDGENAARLLKMKTTVETTATTSRYSCLEQEASGSVIRGFTLTQRV